ncbi:uncharacterized protein BP5553_10099 [Venustampulla echinocandica]|uniref:EamA domain-containing protein n=1 Tax=Venustampulla echinocandica TaxID=2656787 RepID=A0A370TAB6_9HELO|nr:uncharacterized protein BP5553_10099 [Venustampulla echinocandica]RDL30754.1 hypothetical protein BP5553_10099 [Venustampulla echinocandica]
MLRQRPPTSSNAKGAKGPLPRNTARNETNNRNVHNDPHTPLPNDQSPSFSRRRPSARSSSSSGPAETPKNLPEEKETADMEFKDMSRKSQWIALAMMSGACAAFNGVFAKLTTTELTTSFAASVGNFFGLGDGEKVVEFVVRAIFFALNLIFNGIMWALFTKALARGTSTTQVSIINTSSNFMITAILGFVIFSESLPPLWFLGAGLLVAGNVIIGRREEVDTLKPSGADVLEEEGLLGDESEAVELDEGVDAEGNGKPRNGEDILDLDLLGEEEEVRKNSDDLIGLRR